MILIFTLISAFSRAEAAGNKDLICQEMHRLSCAPGAYNDGTGTAEKTGDDGFGQNLHRQMGESAKKKFAGLLKDPDNSYFRKEVLSTTGLSLNPACEDAARTPNEQCLNLMAQGASDLALKQLYGSVTMNPYGIAPPLEDEAILTQNPDFKSVSEDLLEQARQAAGQDKLNDKIRDKIFPGVKALLLEKIDAMISDPELREKIHDKVKAIRYAGTDCSISMTGGENIPGLLMSNAFYNPSDNTFKFCNGLALQNSSEFAMAFVIGHELSHSIDPCGVAIGPKDFTFKYQIKEQSADSTRDQYESQFPFRGVIDCLRGPKSVGAKTKDSALQSGYNYVPGLAPAGQYGSYPPNKATNPLCDQDQITESFADWMGTEILPDYIAKNYPGLTQEQLRFGYSNCWRMLCDASSGGLYTYDVHPLSSKREDYITLMQPKIRAQMGCPPKVADRQHCAVRNESATRRNQRHGDEDAPDTPGVAPTKTDSEVGQ